MAEGSRFDRAVAAALEAEDRLRAAEAHLATGLDARTFLAEAMGQAGCEPKDLEELAKRLDVPGHSNAQFGLNKMVKHICGEAGIKYGRPHSRLGHFLDDEGKAELSQAGGTMLSLFGLAAKIAAATRPGSFGKVNNWAVAEQAVAEARAEREAALAALGRSWGASDVSVSEGGEVHFARFPGVQITARDLPARILTAALAEARSKAA